MTRHHTKLNDNQLHLLLLLYKFRYVTADLLARHRGVLRWSINSALSVLMDRKLIGRHYDDTYKLLGKGASYYLLPDGLRILADDPRVVQENLKVRFRDKSLSDSFVEHHLRVFEAYLKLRASYPGRFQIVTKYELPNNSKYPDPKPDLYLKAKEDNTAYFLDIFDNTPFFAIRQRIEAYIEHEDTDAWPSDQYPKVLLVCQNGTTEKKVLEYLAPRLEDVEFMVTTTTALLTGNRNEMVWSAADNPKDTRSLTDTLIPPT